MNLFDAAPEEMKRLRNQKKDGSVLKHMERQSKLVIPSEITYSPGGSILRQRHIDDLEDDDNILEAVSPVKKIVRRRNNKLSTPKHNERNRPKNNKTKNSATNLKVGGTIVDLSPQAAKKCLTVPSVNTPQGFKLRFSPPDHDVTPYTMGVDGVTEQETWNEFITFSDHAALPGRIDRVEITNPVSSTMNPPYRLESHPMQPQTFDDISRSYTQPLQYNEAHNLRPQSYGSAFVYHEIEMGKKVSSPALPSLMSLGRENPNPLSWISTNIESEVVRGSAHPESECYLNTFSDSTGALRSFTYGTNPLASALMYLPEIGTSHAPSLESSSPSGSISNCNTLQTEHLSSSKVEQTL